MKPGRIACCVPFCRCTVPKDRHPGATEVICAKHWRLVPRALKARKRQCNRRIDKLNAAWQRPAFQERIERSGRYIKFASTITRAYAAEHRTWDACKAAAIEIEAGITATPSPRRNDHADR